MSDQAWAIEMILKNELTIHAHIGLVVGVNPSGSFLYGNFNVGDQYSFVLAVQEVVRQMQ